MKKVLYAALIFALFISSFLILVNIPTGPFQKLRDQPTLGPLGHLFDIGSGTGQTRVLIWQGMAKLTGYHAPLVYPNLKSDNFNPVRWLVGYGPETLAMGYEGYYNPQSYILENPNAIYDRAHNRFWDVYYFYGILGVIAEYGLTLCLLYVALSKIGFITNRKEKNLFLFLTIAGGFSGFILPILGNRIEFIGISIQFGLLLGLIGIFFYKIIQLSDSSRISTISNNIILTGLLSALISHYIELSTGILTFTSSLLFWSCSAMILVIDRIVAAEIFQPIENTGSSHKFINEYLYIGINTLLLSTLLTIFGSRFIINFQNKTDPFSVLSDSFSTISYPVYHTSFGICILITSSFFLGLFLLQPVRSGKKTVLWIYSVLITGFTLIISFIVYIFRANQLAASSETTLSKLDILSKIAHWNWLSTSMFLIISAFLLLLAFSLSIPIIIRKQSPDKKTFDRAAKTLYLPKNLIPWVLSSICCLLGVLYLIVNLNLQPLQAEVLFAAVNSKTNKENIGSAQLIYESLIDLTPLNAGYQRFAGSLFKIILENSKNETQKEYYFAEGLKHIEEAYRLEPLTVYNMIELAGYYKLGGEITQSSAKRDVRFYLSNSYYASALKVKPSRVDYWLSWADLCAVKGDINCAVEKINSALSINKENLEIYSFQGELFSIYGKSLTDPVSRSQAFQTALQAYQIEINLHHSNNTNPAHALLGMAEVLENLGKFENARAALLESETFPEEPGKTDRDWIFFKHIADLSEKLNDRIMQSTYLQKAITLAPEDQKTSLIKQLNLLSP